MHQEQPLARIGQLSFAPGTNRRGRVSGAAWSYVLPSQDLACVVCLGDPSAAAISRLSLLADRVEIFSTAGTGDRWRRIVTEHAWPNVAVRRTDGASSSQPSDLVWLATSGRRLPSQQIRQWRELKRQAKLVYRESRSTAELPNGALSVRLTPLFGEPRSAVPAADAVTLQHFRAAGLEEDSVGRELRRRGIPYLPAAARKFGLASTLSLPLTRLGHLSGPDLASSHAPPRYLSAIAAAEGIDLSEHRWGFSAKGQYSSQKALFFLYRHADLQPEVIVKISQDPSRSHLLENAYRGQRRLQTTEFGRAGRSPRPVFTGTARGMRLVGEEVVAGKAFISRSQGGPACPYAADAVAAIIELGRNTSGRCSAAQVAVVLAPLVTQFFELYRPSAATCEHLQQQIEVLSLAALDVPLVFMHGDPGLQNVVVRANDRLAFLDWENAEPAGMPLWDLFHFLRAYVVWAGRRRALTSRLGATAKHYLEGAELTDFLVGSVERYRRAFELQSSLIAPLFWMHLLVQALREAPRLDPSKVQLGHQLKLLEVLVAGRHSAVLQRILQVEP